MLFIYILVMRNSQNFEVISMHSRVPVFPFLLLSVVCVCVGVGGRSVYLSVEGDTLFRLIL